MSHPVDNFDVVLEKNKKLNVIVAVGGWREKQKEISALQTVEKCLFFEYSSTGNRLDLNYICDNKDNLSMLFETLKDDLSKKVLREFLRTLVTKKSESLAALNTPDERQYFPPFIVLEDNEVFIDCGAFDGDDTTAFIDKISSAPPPARKNWKVYVFEPERENMIKTKNKVKNKSNVVFIEKACYSKKSTVYFRSNLTSSAITSEDEGIAVETETIDNVIGNDKATYIKMDIEGAELDALKGARNTILRCRPKLAVCVYHKEEDLITIPQYIFSLHNDYSFYLRHYGIMHTEVVLYAV
jgi:FkbM family methyltransferase